MTREDIMALFSRTDWMIHPAVEMKTPKKRIKQKDLLITLPEVAAICLECTRANCPGTCKRYKEGYAQAVKALKNSK